MKKQFALNYFCSYVSHILEKDTFSALISHDIQTQPSIFNRVFICFHQIILPFSRVVKSRFRGPYINPRAIVRLEGLRNLKENMYVLLLRITRYDFHNDIKADSMGK
jgi:hypothetical protein